MKSKIPFLAVFLVLVAASCKEPMQYIYADKPQPVNCTGMDATLMHEALYTFEEAISSHYNFRNYSPTTPVYKQNGYAQFMFTGITNTAPFVEIMDDHSKTVAKVISEEDELWVIQDDQYSVNYKSEYVSCLIAGIDDMEIREIITALVEAGSATKEMLAPPLRKRAVNTVDDPELAMFVALEAYYKNLLNRNLHLTYGDE